MIQNDVLELVKKSLKNLIRAKSSSLVVILGPILVILLAGLAFDNSSPYSVKIGAYRPDETNLTTTFLDQLRTQFKVVEYDSEKACVDAIKNSEANTCMVFSANFTIGKPPANNIAFYVDYSRVNLVWTIMQVMTEHVEEQTLKASQSLTRALIDTLDFTQKKIAGQRKTMVDLGTQNELMARNVQELQAELGDIDLTFDENKFPLENLTSAKTQVKQWVDNALTMGDKGLSKAISFIDAADALVKSSSAGSQVKDQLLTSFKNSVEDIEKLQDNFGQTKNLTLNSFERFSKEIDQMANVVSDTKDRLNQADTSRQFSLRVLGSLNKLLDESLLSLLEVQNTFNEIDNKINSIEIRDPEAITQPIVTSIKPVVQEKTYLNYLFPVLIVLVIMFTAFLITPTLILLDKHSPASFRTYMTPVKDISYVLANFITAFILLFIQMIIILSIASIFFSSQVITNIPEAVFLLILINSLFILIGMMIGYAFNSEEAATLTGVSVGAIFLFVSDVIIPIESMPEAFSYIASFNPYVLGSSLLRRALLFDQNLLNIYGDILILLGYIVATALLAAGIYMLTRRYTMQQLIKKLSPVLEKVHLKKKN